MTEDIVVRMQNISKRFGGIQALSNVDLTLGNHQVLGVVGDNGAGKSTLIKILSGVYKPDDGQIFINGRRVVLENARDARKLGISTIYQDLALCPHLNVVDNIFLGQEIQKPLFRTFIKVLDKESMDRKAEQLLDRFGIQIKDMCTQARNLSGGQQQALAIARALYFKARVIIMDEPTAALGVRESKLVLSLIRTLKDQGISTVIISHTLDHVFVVSDRIMVLQKGRKVTEVPTCNVTKEDVVSIISEKEASTE